MAVIINNFEIINAGDSIAIDVSTEVGYVISNILLWTMDDFKDYAKAIDLNSYISGATHNEVIIVDATDVGLERFVNICFIEVTSTAPPTEGCVECSDPAIGITYNLSPYYHCLMTYLLALDVILCRDCDNASSKQMVITINMLIDSIPKAIDVGYYTQAVDMVHKLEKLCAISACKNCPQIFLHAITLYKYSMVSLEENNPLEVTISSLSKSFNNARMRGNLTSSDLYILNAIERIIGGCEVELSYTIRKRLVFLYSHILDRSNEVCRASKRLECQIIPKSKFVQQLIENCDNTPPLFESIYYWQEQEYNTDQADVILKISNTYLSTKPHALVPEFINGKDLINTAVGIGCFLIVNKKLPISSYKIYDALNNDVTSLFEPVIISELNSLLFTSIYKYAPSIINYKIKTI